jgi:hypothetical protein
VVSVGAGRRLSAHGDYGTYKCIPTTAIPTASSAQAHSEANLLVEVILALADAGIVNVLFVALPGGKRLFSAQHLVQHAAQRPHVRLGAVGLVDHLGGEVLSGAPHLNTRATN